jgi:hypothetical protein
MARRINADLAAKFITAEIITAYSKAQTPFLDRKTRVNYSKSLRTALARPSRFGKKMLRSFKTIFPKLKS